MRARSHVTRWRVLALLAVTAAVAVAIPAASGAGPFSGGGPGRHCPQSCSARALISPSVLHKGKSKGETCSGGSIAPGAYDSLTITGFCTVDLGEVAVKHDVTVQPNAGLLAAFGNGPRLSVGGNLNVNSNGVLVLGCEPEASPCFNDPDQNVGSYSSKGTVFGDLHADHALAVIVHDTVVGHDLELRGGGGGVNCDGQDALGGSPAFSTFEDVSVGHNLTIDGMQTCWMGLFRTTVAGNAKYQNNVTADPDGNEIQTNVVQGNLDCRNDNPAAQGGDSEGFMNTAFGNATGECASLSGP